MSSTGFSTPPLVCPRCRSTATEVLATAPSAGVWTIYHCEICLYAWRSTEPEENRDPEKYPVAFRLKPEDMQKFPTVPGIPPLQQK